MPSVPTAKLLAPGEGKTIMLFAVRFDDKVTSGDCGGAMAALMERRRRAGRVLEVLSPGGLEDSFEELAPVLRAKAPPSEYDALAHRHGLTIQSDWIEELERAYGVKL